MPVIPKVSVAPNASLRLAESIGIRYLLILLVIPLVCSLLPFFVERFSLFPSLTASQWTSTLEYGYHADKQDADVVLFGDSSVLFGIDTARLSKELHLKVINLPNTLGSLPVTGSETLRRYLRTNHAPRLIVFCLAPWNLDVGNRWNPHMYEGEEMLLRFGSREQMSSFFRRHPLEVLFFPFRFYAAVISENTGSSSQHRLPPLTQGHLEYVGAESLSKGCVIPTNLVRQKGLGFTSSLATQFASTQTSTQVYLTAIPKCTNVEEIARVSYPALGATAPAVLSPEDFADDGAYVHLLPQSVAVATDTFAKVIEGKLELHERVLSGPHK